MENDADARVREGGLARRASSAKVVFEISTEESGSSSSEEERREPVSSAAAHVLVSSEDEAGAGESSNIETQTETAGGSSVEESVLEESAAPETQAVDVPVPPAAVELIQQAHKKYDLQLSAWCVYIASEVYMRVSCDGVTFIANTQ